MLLLHNFGLMASIEFCDVKLKVDSLKSITSPTSTLLINSAAKYMSLLLNCQRRICTFIKQAQTSTSAHTYLVLGRIITYLMLMKASFHSRLFLNSSALQQQKLLICYLYRCTVHFVVYLSNTLTNSHI